MIERLRHKFRKKKFNPHRNNALLATVLIIGFGAIGGLTIFRSQAAPGGCSTEGILGSGSYVISVPEAGQYKPWVRMQVPETSNSNGMNGIRLELSGSSKQCFTLTTTSTDAVNQWRWINSDANSASTPHVTSQLAAGDYTVIIYGLKAGVKVDKVLLLPSDSTCIPSNNHSNGQPGDNCTTPAPTVSLSASPNSVVSGSASTLSWSATNATSCTASGGWSGSRSTSGGSQSTGSLTANASYILTCVGVGGSSSVSTNVTVTAPAPPTVSLTASPSTLVSGNSSILTWTSTNATSCTASGGWSGSRSTSGGSQSTGSLTGTRTYSLSCNGAGGSATAAATVTVTATPTPDDKAPPVVQMTIPNVTVPQGSSSIVVKDQKGIIWQPLASDTSGIKSLSLTINNQPVVLTNGAVQVGSQANGDYVLRAVATDIYDNTTTATITVRVRHPDFNRSGRVDIFDLSALLNRWGSTTEIGYDINADGVVNIFDLSFLLNRWNSTN